MTISKTKINYKMRNKTNTVLSETIFLAKKMNLLEMAKALAVPARQQASVNLDKINKAKEDVVIVPGKVLSDGEISKKVKVYAMSYSAKAKDKLKKAGCETKTIIEALKKGDKIKGELIR